MQDYAPATESGKLRIAGIISSTPRDELAEPDNNTTSVTDQLRPTEKAKTGSQNVLKTDEAIVMKSAEPAHQASNDDTAESNYVL